MAEEILKAVLEADVKGLVKAVTTAKKELSEVGTTAVEAGKGITVFENSLEKSLGPLRAAAISAEKLKGAQLDLNGVLISSVKAYKSLPDALGKTTTAAPKATNALTNLGRVISDAPFGLIGIANNIDPLIESFTRLKTSTGSTGGALKALGGALLGPAGIGIAITAVTSTLIAFGPAIGRAIGGVSEFDQTLRDAGTKGAEAFSKATDTFGNFLRVVNDSEASVTRQNQALEGANKALSDYGLEVGTISDLQKQGSAIGAIYAQIKQEEAKSSILAAKAAEEYAKGVALGIAIEQGDTLGAAGALSVGNLVKALLTGGTAIGSAATAVAGLGDAFGVANAKQKAYETENEKTKIGIDNLIKSLGQVPGVVEKSDKAKAKSTEATKRNNSEELIANTNRKAALLLVNQETAGLLALSAAAEKAFASKQKSNLLDKQKLLGGATNVSGIKTPGSVAIDPEKLNILQGKVGLFAQTITGLKDNMEGIAELGIGGAIDSVFTAIQNGDNVFKALGDSVKGFVVELVKAVAKALILQAIMTALFPQGAAAQAATGGGFISKLLGGVFGGRAGGGPVTPGGGYIVGENGPEKFYPSQPGMIVPNGGGGGGTLSARISGNSLLFLLNQAGQNSRMNFG